MAKKKSSSKIRALRKKRVLTAGKIKTKGFKFNRDEANER